MTSWTMDTEVAAVSEPRTAVIGPVRIVAAERDFSAVFVCGVLLTGCLGTHQQAATFPRPLWHTFCDSCRAVLAGRKLVERGMSAAIE